MSSPKVALITGANGITGSAIATHLCQHTDASQWSKIIITSRSPLTLPLSDPRLTFIALDFSRPVAELVRSMGPLCGEVTHAYFSSYVHKDDFSELNQANEMLFENFLTALCQVVKNKLQNVTLQTGGKHYQVHLMPVPSPAREEEPRREAALPNFYFPQEDCLLANAKQHGFRWNVIRPEAIIGCTHKPNGMNEALTIAMYMIVCAHLKQEAVMPTNQRYWEGTDDVSSAKAIADLTIFASTKPEAGNQAFNVTNGDYFCWRYMWPRLADFFGAEAHESYQFQSAYPKEGELQLERSLFEWSKDKQQVWDEICDQYNAPQAKATWGYGTWAFQDWVFQRTWSATLSVSKARKYGWTYSVDSYENFRDTFEEMIQSGLIPKAH